MSGREELRANRERTRVFRKPLFWVLVFLVAWLTLIIVQISLGMGADPGGGTPR